jgi:UDP-N-acetylglucosamine 4,6-dehydratase/5-epimerase
MFNQKSILITGGTGSFGKAFVSYILKNYKPKKLIVFSRDELKQFEMSLDFSMEEFDCMRYFLGDVRDEHRLRQAFNGVDYVVHAAALKQVPAAEYNPFECVKTNIIGAENVINASIFNKVKKVIALSTDKAANPINLYGATKLASDKLFIAANNMSGDAKTTFGVVRYGNVIGSRGSVIPLFKKLMESGKKLTITDPRMTRFWITLDQGVKFVVDSIERMCGGELFVPKIASMKMIDLARAMDPDCEFEIIGIRPGEKLHEVMISRDDAQHTVEFEDYYVIKPPFFWWNEDKFLEICGNPHSLVDENFEYRSDLNSCWLTAENFKKVL